MLAIIYMREGVIGLLCDLQEIVKGKLGGEKVDALVKE
jgi:hypothetical protein